MSTAPDHARFAEWDAAYVLGALSPAERRDFEHHLEECERCRAAVAELSALPGLLGRIDSERAFALLQDAVEARLGDETDAPAGLPADLVQRILARDRRQRIGRRAGIVAGLAAAAAVAGIVIVPGVIAAQPDVDTSLHQVVDSRLSANVRLTSVGWGTKVEINCSYAAEQGDGAGSGPWTYSLWVIGDDGDESEVSSWKASSGTTARVGGGTALALDDIASIEVRAADDTVLLSGEIPD
jgi:anti-sigma-K factor RskA